MSGRARGPHAVAKTTQRSAKELAQENTYLRSHRIGDEIARVLLQLTKWAGITAVARYIYLSIAAVAGKSTTAMLQARVNGQIDTTVHVELKFLTVMTIGAIAVAIGGILYGRSREKLYRDTIRHLHPYQELWEKHLDPRRTSSTLTKDGQTRPEDVYDLHR